MALGYKGIGSPLTKSHDARCRTWGGWLLAQGALPVLSMYRVCTTPPWAYGSGTDTWLSSVPHVGSNRARPPVVTRGPRRDYCRSLSTCVYSSVVGLSLALHRSLSTLYFAVFCPATAARLPPRGSGAAPPVRGCTIEPHVESYQEVHQNKSASVRLA